MDFRTCPVPSRFSTPLSSFLFLLFYFIKASHSNLHHLCTLVSWMLMLPHPLISLRLGLTKQVPLPHSTTQDFPGNPLLAYWYNSLRFPPQEILVIKPSINCDGASLILTALMPAIAIICWVCWGVLDNYAFLIWAALLITVICWGVLNLVCIPCLLLL